MAAIYFVAGIFMAIFSVICAANAYHFAAMGFIVASVFLYAGSVICVELESTNET